MTAEAFPAAVRKILSMQWAMVMLVSAILWLLFGWIEARSAFWGGIAGFLPNLYFALRIARARSAEAKKVVRSFYGGETGKLLLTALLFFLIFRLPDILFLPLLAGFVSVIAVFWAALLMRD